MYVNRKNTPISACPLIKSVRLTIIFSFNVVIAGERGRVIEMGESGYAVTFKMTAEEIAALNAENARHAAIRAVRAKAAPESAVVFELAESGHTIEFPATTPEMDIGDLVIARDPSGNEAVRAQ